MKQMIVFFCSLILGVYIYNLIAGGDDASTLSLMTQVWHSDLNMRTMTP